MRQLVSVIVPVYNVEKYLDSCAISIMNQSYRQLEIILIDDGSTDSSGAICDAIALTDARVHVIHKENEGLSVARNVGIEKACGDYILFVDSDDVIDKNMIEVLHHHLIRCKADFSFCDYIKIDGETQNPIVWGEKKGKAQCFSKMALFELSFDSDMRVILPVAWNKLFKSKLFEDIRFPKGKYHEDEFLLHQLISQVDKAVYVRRSLYGYRQREESITDHYNSLRIADRLEAYRLRVLYFESIGAKDLADRGYRFLIKETIWECISSRRSNESKDDIKRFIKGEAHNIKVLFTWERRLKLSIVENLKILVFTQFPMLYSLK